MSGSKKKKSAKSAKNGAARAQSRPTDRKNIKTGGAAGKNTGAASAKSAEKEKKEKLAAAVADATGAAPKSAAAEENAAPISENAAERTATVSADAEGGTADTAAYGTESADMIGSNEAGSADSDKAGDEDDDFDEYDRLACVPAPDVPIPEDPDFTENDFVLSAKELTAEDIIVSDKDGAHGAPVRSADGGKKQNKRGRGGFANVLQIALLVVFASIAAVCIVMLAKNIKGKIDGSKVYNDAEFERPDFNTESAESFNHPSALAMIGGDNAMLSLYDRIAQGKSADSNSQNSEYAEKLAAMKASLTALKAKNPDVYGWIYAEGTTIDHPVMRGSDNDYYLDHAYTGEALPIGSIFLDYNTKDVLTDNYNAVIYGHNVVAVAGSKSSMFHDVTKYLDADFFANHKIYIYTMDGVFIYKPVSIYPTTSDYFYYRTDFPNDAAFLKFANEVVANSKVPCSETFSAGDTMITLSTCTNGATDGRYALHAKLVEVIK